MHACNQRTLSESNKTQNTSARPWECPIHIFTLNIATATAVLALKFQLLNAFLYREIGSPNNMYPTTHGQCALSKLELAKVFDDQVVKMAAILNDLQKVKA